MYHNIITEDILDIYNILSSNNKKSEIQKLNLKFILIKLLNFSKHLSHLMVIFLLMILALI